MERLAIYPVLLSDGVLELRMEWCFDQIIALLLLPVYKAAVCFASNSIERIDFNYYSGGFIR